jgi:ornithine cyclodeaminase/alanine dehydrogenase-like protein (mu-crystallin family)
VLVFSALTGQTEAVLNDEGYLTDLRTGLGGAVAKPGAVPPRCARFLIVGSGTQAYWLARSLRLLQPKAVIAIWGRNPDRAARWLPVWPQVGVVAQVEKDLEAACRAADVQS